MDYLSAKGVKDRKKHILILAGGYDEKLNENIDVYNRLKSYDFQDFGENVFFLKNISNQERSIILRTANIVIYTPKNEHFGIVPVESMYCGAYVIAHKSGGPMESVMDNITGCLMDNEDPIKWGKRIGEFFYPKDGEIMLDIDNNMNSNKLRKILKDHVLNNFSLNTMVHDMVNIFNKDLKKKVN